MGQLLQLAEYLQRGTSSRDLELARLLLRGVHDDAVFSDEESAVAAQAQALFAEVPLQTEGGCAALAAVAHHAQLAVRAQLVAPRVHHKVIVRSDAPHLQMTRCHVTTLRAADIGQGI
jgi:hypothetical protein